MKVAPTQGFKSPQGTLSVQELPKNIRDEVEKLDVFRQHQLDASLEFERATLAVKAKEMHIQQLLTAMISKDDSKVDETSVS